MLQHKFCDFSLRVYPLVHKLVKRIPLYVPSFYSKRTHCPKREIDLHRDCIDVMKDNGWDLVGHEWIVTPGKEDHGRGDLVFHRNDTFLVVECKRRNGKKVVEQAQYYGAAWQLCHTEKNHRVMFAIWTFDEQHVIGVLNNREDALTACNRPCCKKIVKHQSQS